MKMTAAVEWLRRMEIRESFMSFFGGQGQMTDRGFVIVLKFIPVDFKPSSLSARHKVEAENEMGTGEIIDEKWLRNRDKRSLGQRTAFTLITLKTACTVNRTLHDGIVVEGKQVFAHKNIPEAKHCMKCQEHQTNHQVADCKQIHNTCVKCAGLH
jgi:hypothetical protein